MGEGNENESLMNDRPHPGLLPQEKENRSPRFGDADAPGCRAVLPANNRKAAVAMVTNKFSIGAVSPTLSPGERAGVRIPRRIRALNPWNLKMRKPLIFKEAILRFMGRASQITNSISSAVRVRASVKTILCSALLFCLAFVSPLHADDVITNVMSPIVSYQYPDDFSSQALTNGGISSPIVSYQYFEWPGGDVLHLQSSPWVSYYYPGIDGPQIVLQGRVTGAGGAPLSGAAVSAAWGSLPVAATSTDANGNYALPLGAGVYALSASAAGNRSGEVHAASSDSPPMAWLPIQFPSNATAMAFDFIVEGNPMDDVLVCGIGTNNLFSLAAKYIPTNAMSASRLIDVSAWAGTPNELFFGFLGGTSTNATLTIENIRFFSLAEPRLEIAVSGNATLLSWPLTAGGYVVETTPTLATPAWETVTNAPVISADRYVLTNAWSDEARFFRLRPY